MENKKYVIVEIEDCSFTTICDLEDNIYFDSALDAINEAKNRCDGSVVRILEVSRIAELDLSRIEINDDAFKLD